MGNRLGRIVGWKELIEKAKYKAKKLAALCEVSLRQLERHWKKVYNKAPQEWLNRLRLAEAKRLLQEGWPIKEIAFRLGFKQCSHFSRHFKHYTGSTPGSFGASK